MASQMLQHGGDSDKPLTADWDEKACPGVLVGCVGRQTHGVPSYAGSPRAKAGPGFHSPSCFR
ncbi:hypothetical protein J1614_009830 [Plenodomus biglobosus]|nr:hypothetical protein J1614_009830 [Plenodomus biglobosus]